MNLFDKSRAEGNRVSLCRVEKSGVCNTNLKNAGNIGSERAAKNNAFMFSVIESCKMCGRSVENYLKGLLERLKVSRDGDDMTCCLPCFMPA